MKIVLGVSGGIAAYKAAELVRLYRQRDLNVQVVLTRAAGEFVRPLTFAALSGEKVIAEIFAGAAEEAGDAAIEHIAVARSADALVVAPATAHLLAKFAQGLADDFLTTLYLATRAPVVLAPAMNVNMWRHPAVQENLERLRRRGVTIVEPGAGYLACGMEGEGRLAELDAVVAATLAALNARQDWSGRTILIAAGPTQEPLDPVRYLSNRSSGRMGFALAAAAAARGARVVLVAGPTALTPPAGPGIETLAVTTAAEMAAAVLAHFDGADVAIMVAAVADYRPVRPAAAKTPKAEQRFSLELEPTPDILAELGRRKRRQVVVGFAAESGPNLAAARAKLQAKRADLIVFNDVSAAGIGFDAAENAVTLVTAEGEEAIPRAAKQVIAARILQAIDALDATRGRRAAEAGATPRVLVGGR